MKQNYLIYIISIVALMLFSCTKDETSPNEGREIPSANETYASMVININQTTKTLGTTAGGDVYNLNVVSRGLPKKFSQNDLKSPGGNSSILTVDPWITYIGKRDMAIVANDYGVVNHDGEKLVSRFKVDVDSRDLIYDIKADDNPNDVKDIVSKFRGSKGITMTSIIDEIEIKPNITKEECEYTGTNGEEDLNKNRFARNLERIVSKAVITYDEKNSNIKTLEDIGISDDDNPELGKCRILKVGSNDEGQEPCGYILLDHLRKVDDNYTALQTDSTYSGLAFSVEHSAIPIYVYANHAGDCTLSKQSGVNYNTYKDFTSAIHSWKMYEKDPKKVKDKIVRLGNLVEAVYPRPEKPEIPNDPFAPPFPPEDNEFKEPSFAKKVETLGDFKAQIVFPNSEVSVGSVDSKEFKNEIYFFENSCEDLDISKGFYRTAFAKVYATFIPEMHNLYVGGYDPYTYEDIELHQITPEEFKDKYINKRDYTVFYGVKTMRFYTTAEAAKSDGNVDYFVPKSGIQIMDADLTWNEYSAIQKFTFGRCGYRIALNRQRLDVNPEIPGATKYCDTRRNNIYKIVIKGFKKFGMPYDPMDPYDPYLPKKPISDGVDDDRQIDPPVSPNIDKNNPYISVIAKVIPWEIMERDVELE